MKRPRALDPATIGAEFSSVVCSVTIGRLISSKFVVTIDGSVNADNCSAFAGEIQLVLFFCFLCMCIIAIGCFVMVFLISNDFFLLAMSILLLGY